MDSITLAIVTALATSAAKMGEQAITDAYAALKNLLGKKFGATSEVMKAVEGVETRPDSDSRKGTLKEEIHASKAYQDSELLAAAQTLLTLLDKSQAKPGNLTTINQQAGNNAMQVGQVNGTLNIKR